VLSPRNRELLGLVPAALLVTAGFAAIFIQERSAGAAADVTLNRASSASLTCGAIFLGLCLAGHLVIRFALPNADPYLFPLGAVLASVGIVMVYRINPTLARQQAQWMVLGLVLFAATILALRRTGVGVLERYRYTIVAVGIGTTVLPRLPGIGEEVNGAYLNVHVGGISFQPAELAKIALVIFLASYLRDNRQILVTAGRLVPVAPVRGTGIAMASRRGQPAGPGWRGSLLSHGASGNRIWSGRKAAPSTAGQASKRRRYAMLGRDEL